VVGEAGTVAAAIPLITELEPEVVLLDVHLPDGAARRSSTRSPSAPTSAPRAVVSMPRRT
jgi:DNA-binding NarL/FixJ family response regulator